MADTTAANDVITLIKNQHDQVRALLSQVGSGKDTEDGFCELRRLLAVHETAEEEVIYPLLRTTGDQGKRVADTRLSEETEGKELLAQLEKAGPGSSEFTGLFDKFRSAISDHAAAEEREVLPLLEGFDADKLKKVAAAFEAAEKAAPTHPHPHAGSSAAANLAVGPALAIMDRVRDAVRAVL